MFSWVPGKHWQYKHLYLLNFQLTLGTITPPRERSSLSSEIWVVIFKLLSFSRRLRSSRRSLVSGFLFLFPSFEKSAPPAAASGFLLSEAAAGGYVHHDVHKIGCGEDRQGEHKKGRQSKRQNKSRQRQRHRTLTPLAIHNTSKLGHGRLGGIIMGWATRKWPRCVAGRQAHQGWGRGIVVRLKFDSVWIVHLWINEDRVERW